jgi:hypothetical protein
MIEKEIIDRVPLYPGRITLEPVEGETNKYDMFRADDPRDAGTPINKATLDSIIQSRLTGRYYVPTANPIKATSRTITANPIPTSSWIESNGYKDATSGGYSIEGNSVMNSSTSTSKAFDGNSSTYWDTGYTGGAQVVITFSSPIVIKKIKLRLSHGSMIENFTFTFSGSNDKADWTPLYSGTSIPTTLTEFTLTTTGEYKYYRFLTNNGGASVQTFVYDFSISEYDVFIYSLNYVVDAFPTSWTTGQRVMVEIPANVSTIGLTINTLNGVAVGTILQPNKRYELRYTGSAFAAKEV